MGFSNENDSLAWGELSSGLSFTARFFKTLSILSSLVGFFRGQGRTYLETPTCFSWLKNTKYQKRNFFAFCTKFERHTLQRRLSGNLGQGSCKICSAQRCIYVQTATTFVQKVGLIGLKCGFISVIQDTNIIVGLKLLTTGTNVTAVLCVQGKKLNSV